MTDIAWDFRGNAIKEGCAVVFPHSEYQQLVEGKVLKITPKMVRIECTAGHESVPRAKFNTSLPTHKGTPKITTRLHSNVVVVSY